MKISIITVCYQSCQTLKYAIESVLSQTRCDIEYIVVDGGSKDGTVDLIKSYSGISKWVSEPDKGIYDAMNKGILMATGDYVGFLHADDLLAHSSIISELSSLLIESQADVVYGDLEYVQKEDVTKIVRYWKSCEFVPSLLPMGWMPPHPTVYVKRELFNTVGLFNVIYKIAADYDFMLRLFGSPSIKAAYMPQVIVKMRVGGTSNRSLINIIKKSREDYRAIRSNKIGGVFTLFNKNFSKISQFFKR